MLSTRTESNQDKHRGELGYLHFSSFKMDKQGSLHVDPNIIRNARRDQRQYWKSIPCPTGLKCSDMDLIDCTRPSLRSQDKVSYQETHI